MPKFDFVKIYEESETLYKRHQRGIGGQQITEADSFDYWLAKVAYTHGENYGYNYAVKEMDDCFGSE